MPRARGRGARARAAAGAIANAYGGGTHETQFRDATLRDTLRDEENGVERVIRGRRSAMTRAGRMDLVYVSPEGLAREDVRRGRVLDAPYVGLAARGAERAPSPQLGARPRRRRQ
jgi:hypothetical protein